MSKVNFRNAGKETFSPPSRTPSASLSFDTRSAFMRHPHAEATR
jgi:hypothetical protein